MNDDDFEQVLARFDRRTSRGGGRIAEETANRYRSKARDFREWLQDQDKTIEEAHALDLEDWYHVLDSNYQSDSAVSKGKGALAAFFDIANKLANSDRIDIEPWGYETPADRASYSPETRDTLKQRESREDLQYLEAEQVYAMAQAAETVRDELIIRLLFRTGCRVTELCNIRWPRDVNREAAHIHIQGKGRKNRTVGYRKTREMVFLLRAWIEERRPAVYYADDSEYLFPTSHSERITRDTVESVVRKAADAADLQEVYGVNTEGVELHAVTPHVLRHSFAMAALEAGWDVFTLSQALGHESTEITTSTYLHENEKQVLDAYKTMGPIATGG